ncbi:MAG TPA: hypothetical protein VFU97_24315 [Xanthobacteraceae bacterium]|nr:hypothetical protein [Xanthobacteraceae bacterium]
MTTQAVTAEIVRTTPSSEYHGLTMVVSPAEALRRMQELQAFISQVMVNKLDYGIIPGTEKPTLLQPGAQKLAELYGFAVSFDDVETIKDWDKPLFYFRKKCLLTSRRDGRFIGDGVGSCNSKEDRYAWRWVWDSEVPAGVDRKTLRVKTFDTKRGASKKYRLPNEDIFSLVNTIEKMACKRALIHAVISATRSAGIFTQDVEDLPEDAMGEPEDARSWEVDSPAAAAKAAQSEAYAALEKEVLAVKDREGLQAMAGKIKDAKISDDQRRGLKGLWDKAKAAVLKAEKEAKEKAAQDAATAGREPGED